MIQFCHIIIHPLSSYPLLDIQLSEIETPLYHFKTRAILIPQFLDFSLKKIV